MKLTKKTILSIILPISLFVVASCGHEHSLTASYNYDESTHWQECFGCDEKFNEKEHNFTEWEINSDKTLEVRECSCGYEETREYVNPHPTCSFTNYVSNNDATCTKNGTETAICDGCNKTHTREVPDSKVPHEFVNYVANNDETCTSNETETAKCQNCDATDTRDIADSKAKHSFTNYVSNNDATCAKLETETAKCNHCDATDTRDVPDTKKEHTYGDLVSYQVGNCTTEEILAHYQCSVCDTYFTEEKVETTYSEINNGFTHTYGEWVVTEPTFNQEGSRYRECTCSHREDEVLPKLIKVQEIEVVNSKLTLVEGQKVELRVAVLTEGADSYRVEWTTSDSSIKVIKENDKYYVVGMDLDESLAQVEGTVRVTVTNFAAGIDYESITDTVSIKVVNPIVEYKFDNGAIVNTGTNKEVTERVTTLSGQTSIDSTKKVEYGSDSYGNSNNAIKLDQKKEGGNHFVINGIDLGTNDFTIKTRMNISGVVTNDNSSCYLFGIGDETDANGNVKDVKAPYFNVSFKLGQDKNRVRFVVDSKVNEKNANQEVLYLPYGEWIDVMVIRNADTLTLVITEVDSGVTLLNTITLSSSEAVNFTSNASLAFSGYSGCQNGAPNNYVYYDEIQVYDFSINGEGTVVKHNYGEFVAHDSATCSNNANEIAHCTICNSSIIRDIPNTKIDHDFANYESNNDASCVKNCTETSKCTYCDVTDTREIANSKVEHAFGDLIEANIPENCVDSGYLSHYQCSVCQKYFNAEKVEVTLEDITIVGGHSYTDWVYDSYPTFDEEGSRTRGCNNCEHTETETLDKLIKVQEIEIEYGSSKVVENKVIKLKVDIITEGAEDYDVEWTSENSSAISISKVDGKYYATINTLEAGVDSLVVTITVTVTNALGNVSYDSVTDSIELTVIKNDVAAIAEFTFTNGLTNTGSDSTIRGVGIDNTNANRYAEVDDMSSYIHTSHVVGSTTYQLGGEALCASHSSTRPSFGIKGIDTGSGDFTISTKYYVVSDFIKGKFDKNNQWYVMGTASQDTTSSKPEIPNFSILLGKDSNDAGYFRTTVTLNGQTKELFVYNQEGYIAGRTWVEIRIIKEGTTVTVSIIVPQHPTQAKVTSSSVTFNLDSVEDLKITTDQVLGFGCNYGASRPGNDSYYDDIRVYDYAVDYSQLAN